MFIGIKNKVRKIGRWIRYNPPSSMTGKGWRLFYKEFSNKAPIRYYFYNTFPKKYIRPLRWKYRAISEWIEYRTISKYHVLETGLEPGYHDLETQILHVNFNLFKDFVEVQQAYQTHWADQTIKKGFWERHLPLYRTIFSSRNPELGLRHFQWAATLDDPSIPPHEQCPGQAISAREILELYDWWVNKRPARQDVKIKNFHDQGLGILGSLDEDFDPESEDFKEYMKSVHAQHDLEDAWGEEDTEMLIRLMKIRQGLWT